MSDTAPIFDWLLDGAPGAREPEDVLAELCRRLTGGSVELARAALFVVMPHPLILGTAYFWTPGTPVEVSPASLSRQDDDDFQSSLPVHVMRTGSEIRRRLIDPSSPRDFPALAEFAARGLTDYLICPLPFSTGEFQAVSWSTSKADGFSPEEIASLRALRRPLARIVETLALRQLARTLLDTYVGHHSGERVLAGAIHRGDVERIRAVVMLADLRDFTALSNTRPAEAMIACINAFFDAAVPAIERERGEVLKFMGDGLLAIFPCNGEAPGDVCRAALRSAVALRRELALGLGTERSTAYGLALHLGDVLYGNIGAGHRLDFTAIGASVNKAARLEKLAGRLGLPLVTSADFAAAAEAGLVPLGKYALRGFSEVELVHGLPEERA